ILGVVGDTQYQHEAVVRMGPGYGRPLGDLIFVYDRTAKVDYPSFYADEGHVMVLNDEEEVLTELYPQRQTFKSNGMQMTAAGISHGFFRDLYVSMGNKLSSTDYLVRLSIKPLVSWIWLGGCLMLLSAIFFFVRRRKNV
ncbi:cytochrome c-type biogenesis CcmF C-terminal domain-containing protein, partial [Turicimonas muris]